ncbi:hypothetical protein BGX31_008774 [Mortierella sp. GBA43]|nr:hypothetical protein BGX31_008774 [Mortierella sp. GBA43]
MNKPESQLFRARSSPTIVTIPTRQDPKSRQRVIRWKDILLYFVDAQCVKHGGDVVLFLTDDDLEDLVPLRIAHHPGVVLEVVTLEDIQGESTPVAASSLTLALESGSTASNSMASNQVALRIADTDTNQALVVSSHGNSSGALVQELPTLGTDHFQPWTRSGMDQQEQIRQLQQRIEEVHATIQQTQEQTRLSQQQIQDQVDNALEDLKQTDQRRMQQHNEDVAQVTQQLGEQRQRLDSALQEIQQTSRQTQEQTKLSQQQIQVPIDKILQDLQQADQRTLHSEQQMAQQLDQQRQQFDVVLQEMQDLKLQVQRTQQQNEQSQQQIHDRDETTRHHEHSTPEKRRQEITQAFDHLMLTQRVQATLAISYNDLSIPRLFIILPKRTANVDEQAGPSSMQFRLYYLCECGTRTMTERCNDMHKVHLANHPGYDLVNHNDFFDKYGSYLRMMMHMVKYGIRTSGLLVPPLLGLGHTSNTDMDQHHLSFVQQNISRLVDDTITYIEESTGTLDKDNDTATRHSLSASDLEKITSYLDVKDSVSFTGDLRRMTTPDRRIWICNDHWNVEVILRELKSIIDVSGGAFVDDVQVEVKMESKPLATQLKENLIQLSISQEPEEGFINCFNGIESLWIDFGRLSMTVHSISQGEVKNVAIKIKRLSDLTLNDLDFIQQCHPVLLEITHTPQREDEERLLKTLQHNITITRLHIGTYASRTLAVINLVVWTREMLLQSGHQPALRTLQVLNDGLTPYNVNSDTFQITATVSFADGSTTFDMESHVRLGDNGDEFIRQYGWSIKTFIASSSYSDRHAELLDAITLERGSKIATFGIHHDLLTSRGLDTIDRVIARAPGPTAIRLFLEWHCFFYGDTSID